MPLATAADPDRLTHRAFGVPNTSMTPEIWEAIEGKANELARKLSVPVQAGQAYATIDRLDGFEKVETDDADMQHHQAQLTGQFLLDHGLAGLERFPTDDELIAAARAL